MSKNFSRSFSCSRSHKIYIRLNKIKLRSSCAYHALWPLSYDLDKIQDRDKSANRCNGGIWVGIRVHHTTHNRLINLTLSHVTHFHFSLTLTPCYLIYPRNIIAGLVFQKYLKKTHHNAPVFGHKVKCIRRQFCFVIRVTAPFTPMNAVLMSPWARCCFVYLTNGGRHD